MIQEGHARCKRGLQLFLIALKQVHDDAPDQHGHEAEVTAFWQHVLLFQYLHDAFEDAGQEVEEELLVDDVSFTPHDRRTNNSCNESKCIVAFACHLAQPALDEFVYEDEHAEVATMLP